jgi:antitoxin ParD1/3/4
LPERGQLGCTHVKDVAIVGGVAVHHVLSNLGKRRALNARIEMLRKRSKVLKSMADFETDQYRRQAKDVCSDLRGAWERAVEKVGAGVFASQSALVAAALERMAQVEEEREIARVALADKIQRRLQWPREAFVDGGQAFVLARARLAAGGW